MNPGTDIDYIVTVGNVEVVSFFFIIVLLFFSKWCEISHSFLHLTYRRHPFLQNGFYPISFSFLLIIVLRRVLFYPFFSGLLHFISYLSTFSFPMCTFTGSFGKCEFNSHLPCRFGKCSARVGEILIHIIIFIYIIHSLFIIHY